VPESDLASRTDNDGSVTSFGYDNANQLTSEARSTPNAYTATYAYDSNGNRTSKTIGGVETDYTYDSHDHLTAAGTKSYAYDANGNCTSVTLNNQTTTLAYDYNNRIGQITYPNSSTNTFQYNGLGLRTQKVDSTGTRNYVCDGAGVASTVLSDGNAVYSDGSERRSGASSFRHTDALGSTRGITNASQSATDGILLDAFGMTASRTGSTPTPFGFVGSEQYQSDPDSGLMLLGHRYYDPSIGRFITSDPVQDGDNWYAYCGNNPLGGTDPEGLQFVTPVIGNEAVFVRPSIEIQLPRISIEWPRIGEIVPRFPWIPWPIYYSGPIPEYGQPGKPPWFDHPNLPPGPGYEWRGPDKPGGQKGSWFDPKTGRMLHPDPNHPKPIGPHWDYRGPEGNYRIGDDGSWTPKDKWTPPVPPPPGSGLC
jgi:RHS repeat-associated protein